MREAFQAYDQSGGYLKKLYIYIQRKKNKLRRDHTHDADAIKVCIGSHF